MKKYIRCHCEEGCLQPDAAIHFSGQAVSYGLPRYARNDTYFFVIQAKSILEQLLIFKSGSMYG